MNCRCCNKPMEEKLQPALTPNGTPSTLVTCWSAFCSLRAFTFTLEGYADMDLTAYCPDAQGEAIEQMQARVATLTERLALFGEV